jgi:hypothetical protein
LYALALENYWNGCCAEFLIQAKLVSYLYRLSILIQDAWDQLVMVTHTCDASCGEAQVRGFASLRPKGETLSEK